MHAIEGGKGKGLTLIRVRVLREVRDKTKLFFSENEAWCSQHCVVGGGGGHSAGQWSVLEGHLE